MRIGPFTFGRVRAADAPVSAAPDELGASGTINLSGFLQQLEYNTDLTGSKGIKAFSRMASSDGSTQEALGHITAPILNATWEVDPCGHEPDDLEIAEAVRCSLMEWPQQPFSEFLGQALECLVYGHALFEPVWEVQQHALCYEDPGSAAGDLVESPSRQFVTLRRMAPRLQETVWRWNVDEHGGELESVVQHVYIGGTFREIEIPADRLVVFTLAKRGDDWTGTSMLRGAYKHWVFKETIEKIEAIALERHGVGTWVCYLPDDRKQDGGLKTDIEARLSEIRAGARPFLVVPGPKQSTTAPGFTLEILSPQGQPPDFKSAKEYHRGEIKGAVLVRFAELGHSAVGARATGDTQSKIWYDALEGIANFVCDVINQQYVRRFVDMNFPQVDEYPTLNARGIQARSLQEFADSIYKLVSAGAIDADQGFRKYVRREVSAPPEDDPAASDAAAQPPVPQYPPPATPTTQGGPNGDQPSSGGGGGGQPAAMPGMPAADSG